MLRSSVKSPLDTRSLSSQDVLVINNSQVLSLLVMDLCTGLCTLFIFLHQPCQSVEYALRKQRDKI